MPRDAKADFSASAARKSWSKSEAMALGVSGGLAGATAKTATAPLERVRILNQIGAAVGTMSTLRKVVHNEGFWALWRGNWPNVVRIFPNKWVLLSCSDLYKGVLGPLNLSTFWLGGISGAMAGASAVSLTYPLDLTRTRMAGFLQERGSQSRYKTIFGTMWLIAREEGVIGLYRGIGLTLAGAFPYEGVKFGCYDMLKRSCLDENSGAHHKVWCGACAGMIAHLVTCAPTADQTRDLH